MDKWAILLDSESYILGLQYFSPTESIPAGYLQISESVYIETFEYLQPWSKFISGQIYNGKEEEDEYKIKKNIEDLRDRMKYVQAEITLNTFLEESTTVLETELDNLKLRYEAILAT